jgi:hypothetical protein
VVLLEEEARVPKRGPAALFLFCSAVGALIGVGGLTRYAFGWLIIPAVVFVGFFGGKRRIMMALLTLAIFLAILSPWIARNYQVSGTPFGTAGYAVVEQTMLFSEHRLERSLQPELRLSPMAFLMKLMVNGRQILQSDLPRLGGTWAAAFFLVGLFVAFRNPAITRLRYFLLGSLVIFVFVQALGRTQLSEDSPDINSENLLVIFVPLVLVYGVSLFFLLLDQVNLPLIELRYVVTAVFGILVGAPMIFAFLPPKTIPISYPPYYPPVIQTIAGWVKEKELMMSDIPWAVAWYGDRQCVWLTLDAQKDFLEINDYQKPVAVLYLTPATMDSRFLTQWIRAGEQSWGSFILESMVKKEVPPSFPLRKSPAGFLPEQLVLTDTDRWRKP